MRVPVASELTLPVLRHLSLMNFSYRWFNHSCAQAGTTRLGPSSIDWLDSRRYCDYDKRTLIGTLRCSIQSPKPWWVRERPVSTLEQIQILNGTGPGARRSKRHLLASRTRCKCTFIAYNLTPWVHGSRWRICYTRTSFDCVERGFYVSLTIFYSVISRLGSRGPNFWIDMIV